MTPTRQRRLPGEWLGAFAKHWLDRRTLDTVVLPAISDLQHEWLESAASKRARGLVRIRGYWAFWKAIGLYLVSTLQVSLPSVLLRAAGEMTLLLSIVAVIFLAPIFHSFTAQFGVVSALTLASFLTPSMLSPLLPAAFFLSVVNGRAVRSVSGIGRLPAVLAASVACGAVTLVLMMSAVPASNQAFRSMIFEKLQARVVNPTSVQPAPKSTDEMGWIDLRNPSRVDSFLGRRVLNQRLALATAPVAFGLFACGLLRRSPARVGRIVAALLVILFYGVITVASSRPAYADLVGPWTANILVGALALALLLSSQAERCRAA